MAKRLFSLINNFKFNLCTISSVKPNALSQLPFRVCAFHSSQKHNDLMEFFDDKDNWSKNEVKVGRAWRKDELRIKSNEDLHKLWFVLLKEKNMLLTMEHEYNSKLEVLPSPERLDKVKESMLNLEEVVRERNRAYYELETGETGERPARLEYNRLGLAFWYKCAEHVLPPELNRSYLYKRYIGYNRNEVAKFRLYYKEKIFLERRKERNRLTNEVIGLLKRFPDMDMEALKEKYPTVDIERCKRLKKVRGHYANA